MNKNMKIFYTLGAVVLFLSLCLTGCDNFFEPPAAKTEDGKGLVVFQFGPAGSRTLLPDTFEFSDFTLTLTPITGNGGTADGDPETFDKNDLETATPRGVMELSQQGWWRVTSVFYADIASTKTIIADGVDQDFQVGSSLKTVTIELEFELDSGEGTLKYAITIPSGMTLQYGEAEIALTYLGGIPTPPDPSYTLTLVPDHLDPGNTEEDTYSTAAGYYLVVVTINDTLGERKAVYTEIVHIYPGQTTELIKDFTLTDFHSTVDTYTVTFNLNHSDATGASATPDPIPTTTGTITLPTDPTRTAGWGARVFFDGWYLADGTTSFNETDVTGDMEVFAHWRFQAGTPTVVGDVMTIIAPATTSNSGDSDSSIQGAWNGTTNADGSVSWTSGAARFAFPAGYEDYDFLDLDYVATDLAGGTVLKEGETNIDYARRNGGGAYAHPYGASGTLLFNLKTVTGVQTSVSLQIYNATQAGADSSIKWTKATLTKGTRYAITFSGETYIGWEKPDDISAVAGVVIGPMPVPETRTDYIFTGWYDESVTPNVAYTDSTPMPAKELNLVARWAPMIPGLTSITVTFTEDNLTVVGGGNITITGGGTGYDWDRSGYGNNYSFVRIAVTLGTGATLGDYDEITFTLDQYDGGISGDNQNYKDIGVLAAASFVGVNNFTGSPLNPGQDDPDYRVATPAQYTQGDTSQSFTIDKASAAASLSGDIELIIYSHSPANAGMLVSNLVITIP
jgi:uncharacterized repeat protein (TIGR02543 family)